MTHLMGPTLLLLLVSIHQCQQVNARPISAGDVLGKLVNSDVFDSDVESIWTEKRPIWQDRATGGRKMMPIDPINEYIDLSWVRK